MLNIGTAGYRALAFAVCASYAGVTSRMLTEKRRSGTGEALRLTSSSRRRRSALGWISKTSGQSFTPACLRLWIVIIKKSGVRVAMGMPPLL
jgi:hypothetical protein